MASRVEYYRQKLSSIPESEWEHFLLAESGLPGPRGNLELAQAAAELGRNEQFLLWCKYSPQEAPVNDPKEFLVFCGVLGFGRMVVEGLIEKLADIRFFASDPRWRIRESAAMALQNVGKDNFDYLLEIANKWSAGNWFEKRVVIAALAEPALLTNLDFSQTVFDIFDQITGSILTVSDRENEGYRVVRQGLAYAWSVVVAAWPNDGKARMEYWLQSEDKDIHWIMKQNLNKKRLKKMDPNWVSCWLARL